MSRKPSSKAMFCRWHYRHTFFHCIQTLMVDDLCGPWWKELDDFDKAYVLKGYNARRRKRRKK